MLASIRVVLVHTSHPGNIGAAARAMKTMGLSQLYLVAPKLRPEETAVARAAGAEDVLANAKIVASLEQALVGCHFVVGTSARARAVPWPTLSTRELGSQMVAAATQGAVALVFGNEQSGLSNAELAQCHYHVNIPANPEYSSLNVAAAVQILCYEIYLASLSASPQIDPESVVTHDELAGFYQHLEQVLVAIDFLNPQEPKHLMQKLRRLYNRANLSPMELHILRGILTQTTRALTQVVVS